MYSKAWLGRPLQDTQLSQDGSNSLGCNDEFGCNTAASAEQSHQHSPSADHCHQPGKGSVYPRAPRGTNSSLFLHLSLPGTAGLAWSHLILLENTRSPGSVRSAPHSPSPTRLKVFLVPPAQPGWGNVETPTSPGSSCSLPWPPSRSTSQEGRKER